MSKRTKSPWALFLEAVARALQVLHPGLGRYDRVVYARVVAFDQNMGEVSNVQKLWTCDVRVLDRNLDPDPAYPVIRGVPLDPIEISDSGQALFPKAFEGLVVRLGWMYADRSMPYIVGLTAEGQLVPLASMGELTDLLLQTIILLSRPVQTAVGPGPYDGGTLAELELLKARIP